ncbi:MAG: hypothetical protein HFI38_12820 [Lachnospiraceae bacterium]|nr:hypothetical protein [Lachnospiraceae bacterium]
MLVSSATSASYNASAAAAAAVKAVPAEQTAQKSEAPVQRTPDTDTFVKSSEAENTVEAKKLSADQISRYQEQRTASFTKMINEIVSSQANKGKKAQLEKNGITKDLFTDLVVTPEQQLAAQQAIGEDGEWGVNAVATRIMDMCVALSGGDASKIEEMRAAVDKGFQQAVGQWGGSLPSICSQTHDEINKRFDYWKENGNLDGYQYQKAGVE